MGMVRVEDFRSTVDQAELGRVTDVGTGNRRRRIAERIGAVAHRLVFEAEVLVLHMHVIDAERLAAIVDRAATGTVCIGQGIALRKEIALFIQRTERFVADFVVVEHEFTEVRTGAVLDHDLPAAGGRGHGAAAEGFPIGRTTGFDDEGSEHAHHRQLTILAVGVELADAFLGVRVDVPLELAALLFFDDGIGIGRRGRCAGGAHDHARSMDVQADRAAALFQLVGELDLDAIALVGANRQGLNPLGLHARDHGSGIEAFLVARRLIRRFFGAHLIQVLVQHIHVAGIEIEPLVQRDLDIDRGHIVLLHWGRSRALPAAGQRHRLDPGIGHEEHVLSTRAILVHHGGGVVHAGVDALHLRILGHVVHDPLMLLFNHRGTLGLAAHRIFDDRLALELFRPAWQLVVHRNMLRCWLPYV